MTSPAADAVERLCRWSPGFDVPHGAYHDGEPCPYHVAAAFMRGEPDPRDLAAEWQIDITAALKPNGAVPLTLNGANSSHPFAVRAARERVKAITRNAVLTAGVPALGAVHVAMHYQPRTNTVRDPDNLIATLKPAIDALHQPDPRRPSAWVPVIPDDGPRYVTWTPPRIHPAVKGGAAALWLILRSSTAAE